jgi:hypothetical protein
MLERNRGPNCLSDLALDQWLVGELKPESVRTHMDACTQCASRLERLESDQLAFRDSAPVLVRPLQPEPRASLGQRVRQWLLPGVPLIAVVAVLILWFRTSAEPQEQQTTQAVEVGRSKGNASIGYYIKRNSQVTRGMDGARLHPYDAIRFTYSSSKPKHLVIVSRDGAGTTSVYYANGSSSAAVSAGRDVAISESVVLDTTLGDEVVYGFFCEGPTLVSEITRALKEDPEAPSLELCSVATLRWKKVAP